MSYKGPSQNYNWLFPTGVTQSPLKNSFAYSLMSKSTYVLYPKSKKMRKPVWSVPNSFTNMHGRSTALGGNLLNSDRDVSSF